MFHNTVTLSDLPDSYNEQISEEIENLKKIHLKQAY